MNETNQYIPPYPNKLRQYRLKRKLTQEDVIKALRHESASRLSAWESGKSMPKLENVILLSLLYKTSIEKLYGPLYKTLKRRFYTLAKKSIYTPTMDVYPKTNEMTEDECLDYLARILVSIYLERQGIKSDLNL